MTDAERINQLEECLDKCLKSFILLKSTFKNIGLTKTTLIIEDMIIPEIEKVLNESSNNNSTTSR